MAKLAASTNENAERERRENAEGQALPFASSVVETSGMGKRRVSVTSISKTPQHEREARWRSCVSSSSSMKRYPSQGFCEGLKIPLPYAVQKSVALPSASSTRLLKLLPKLPTCEFTSMAATRLEPETTTKSHSLARPGSHAVELCGRKRVWAPRSPIV